VRGKLQQSAVAVECSGANIVFQTHRTIWAEGKWVTVALRDLYVGKRLECSECADMKKQIRP
jgi:hypothetical protein